MPTNDHKDDEPPPTAAAGSDETAIGPAGDETEIVPPLPPATPGLAWTHTPVDDDDDDDHEDTVSWGAAAERASVILIGAVAAALVVGLLAWLGFYLYDQSKPAPAADATTSPAATMPAAALPPISSAAAPVPPPSTVTVTPAPPSTVTVEAAPPPPGPGAGVPPPSHGTDIFTICPDGHEGVVGGHTTCAFAENVRRTFYNSGMPAMFTAYSPVTGDAYQMTCVGRYPAYFEDGSVKMSTRCYGGDYAEVVIW